MHAGTRRGDWSFGNEDKSRLIYPSITMATNKLTHSAVIDSCQATPPGCDVIGWRGGGGGYIRQDAEGERGTKECQERKDGENQRREG